jgi:hypothetical protein
MKFCPRSLLKRTHHAKHLLELALHFSQPIPSFCYRIENQRRILGKWEQIGLAFGKRFLARPCMLTRNRISRRYSAQLHRSPLRNRSPHPATYQKVKTQSQRERKKAYLKLPMSVWATIQPPFLKPSWMILQSNVSLSTEYFGQESPICGHLGRSVEQDFFSKGKLFITKLSYCFVMQSQLFPIDGH